MRKQLFPHYKIGHFINQPENPTQFEITLFDEMEEPDVEDVHRHTFYEILWVDRGKSRQTIDYQTYELGPGSLFFISPGQLHEFEEWQPLEGGTLMFTSDFFLLGQTVDKLFELSYLDNTYSVPRLTPDPYEFAMIRKLIDLMLYENRQNPENDQVIRSLLQATLHKIQEIVNTESASGMSKFYLVLYKKFFSLLEEQFEKGKTAIWYASQLDITQHHLNLIVKEVTGKTTSEVIRGRTILEAKRMLTFSDMTVSQIAGSLHQYDSSYFSKTFRKEVGVSPLEFRSKMSEKYRNS